MFVLYLQAIEQARDQQLNEAKQKLIKEAREKEHVEIQVLLFGVKDMKYP